MTTRRLAAILAADIAGYSRLMAADEVGTLKATRREVIDPAIAEYNGRIVKTTGDGMLVDFASAVDAVTCAMAVQEKMAARGGNLAFRIGINVGDIIIDGDDIFGDGVNVAARVEGECQPGGVYLSAQAFDQMRNKTAFAFDDFGERQLKNIDRPIRIYAVTPSTNTVRPSLATHSVPRLSIVVLPFENIGGNPDHEYFVDGVTESLTTDLSCIAGAFVIARNTAFTFKGKATDVKKLGRELNVRYVLEGTPSQHRPRCSRFPFAEVQAPDARNIAARDFRSGKPCRAAAANTPFRRLGSYVRAAGPYRQETGRRIRSRSARPAGSREGDHPA